MRKTTVIEAATAHAAETGLPATVIAEMWEHLIEGSITYELAEWGRLRG